MHPVITDQLEHHSVTAQAIVDSKAAKGKITDHLYASYHLFRNFVVLLACGLFESPKHMAQMLLTHTDAALRETFPHAIADMEENTSLVDLDDAIDNGEEFSEATLFYVDGFPYLRTYTNGDPCDGFNPSVLEPQEDDEPVTGPEEFPCGCAICEAAKAGCEEAEAEAEALCVSEEDCGVLSSKTVAQVEAGMNAADSLRYGPLSPAALDYNHLKAKQLCGVALTVDEEEALPQLHTIVVEEASARIVQQRAFERQRAREIAAANEAQAATETEPTFQNVLLRLAANYFRETPGADINAVARICRGFINAPEQIQRLFRSASCFLNIKVEPHGFGVLLDNGISIAVCRDDREVCCLVCKVE